MRSSDPVLNRRSLLSGMSLALLTIALKQGHQHVRAATKLQGTVATSGHEFLYQNSHFEIADIVSPVTQALLANARQYAGPSKRSLQRLLDASEFVVDYIGHKNRWGRERVRLPVPDIDVVSIGAQLLILGAVRVRPQSFDKDRLEQFLAIEQGARSLRQGLWSLPFYRVRNANDAIDADDSVGAFHIFEGTIKKVGTFGSRIFLNFGDDYKRDVTATLENRFIRQWKRDVKKQQDPFIVPDYHSLAGESVQIRGFVEWINGPSIAIRHPMNLRLL